MLDVPHKVTIELPTFLEEEQRFSRFGTTHIGNKQDCSLHFTQKYAWLKDDSLNICQDFCSRTMHSPFGFFLSFVGLLVKYTFALSREIFSKLLALYIQLILMDCQDCIPKQTRSRPEADQYMQCRFFHSFFFIPFIQWNASPLTPFRSDIFSALAPSVT